MELTAKTLQEVTFGAKVRGYDPAEVDDFIAAVAEGVEELQERLRRANERATKAEQQLATVGSDAPAAAAEPVAAPAASNGSAEISKVWERAVAAAEQAMEEAKAEAQRLLDEARTRADTQLGDARREAETTISTAQAEATRITEESQAQLKIEIQKLEGLRDQLNTDVSGLADFVESEKEKLRSRITDALSAIDNYGSGAGPLTEVSKNPFSEAAPSAASVTTDSWAAPVTTSTSADDSPWAAEGVADATNEAWSDAQPQSEDNGDSDGHGGSNNEGSGDWASASAGDAPVWGDPEPQSQPEQQQAADWGDWNNQGDWNQNQGDWNNQGSDPQSSDNQSSQGSGDSDDQESDPFLAELRRAVQDDGPLGPREEGDDSIHDLYSNDDDDRNGFFRRKQ
jgi:DivIVA domain-containing protein